MRTHRRTTPCPAQRNGKFVEGDNVFADRAFAALRDGSLVADKNGLVILETTEGGDQIICPCEGRHGAHPKTLDECRGAAIAAYQDHLEKEWILGTEAEIPQNQPRGVVQPRPRMTRTPHGLVALLLLSTLGTGCDGDVQPAVAQGLEPTWWPRRTAKC